MRNAPRERRESRRDEASPIALVAIAGSAGSLAAMREILSHLPADFAAPIVYQQHLSRFRTSVLAELLQCRTALTVRWAQEGDRLTAGVIYVCPVGAPSGSRTSGRSRWPQCPIRATSGTPPMAFLRQWPRAMGPRPWSSC